MEEKTIWEKIADVLLQHNFDVYPPATHIGECKKEYVVIKADGSAQNAGYSSTMNYYTLMLYVPQNAYTRLEKFKKEIKDILAVELYPMLMPTGLETPDFFDDEIKAYMATIQYRNNVRNKQL